MSFFSISLLFIVNLFIFQAVLCRSGDVRRCEDLLLEAVSCSFSSSVWPTIALAHFYQYVRGDVRTSIRLLKRCLQNRKKLVLNIVNNVSEIIKNGFNISNQDSDDENLSGVEILNYSPMQIKNNDNSNHKNKINNTNNINNRNNNKFFEYERRIISEEASLLVSLSFCYLENNDLINAKINCNKAISLDSTMSSAYRCLAIITMSLYVQEENVRNLDIENIIQNNIVNVHENRNENVNGNFNGNLESSCTLGSRSASTLTIEAAKNEKAVLSVVRVFSLTLKYAYVSPYALRCCSLFSALRNRPTEALKLIEASVISGSTHALTFRALGIMTYLYTPNLTPTVRIDKSINYLRDCIKLTPLGSPCDLEAMLLLGQLLIEKKQYKQAKIVFKDALKIKPDSSILLANYAVVLSYINLNSNFKRNVQSDEMYVQDILSLTSLGEIIQFENPEILFFAAINPELLRTVKLRNVPKMRNIPEGNNDNDSGTVFEKNGLMQDTNNHTKSNENGNKNNHSNYHTNTGVGTFISDFNHSNSMNAHIYYLYGMYCVRDGTKTGLEKSKKLFTLAINISVNKNENKIVNEKENGSENGNGSPNKSKNLNGKVKENRNVSTPHSLAVYMLGWIAEIQNNLKLAEKFYNYSIESCPKNDPIKFLQLMGTVQENFQETRTCLELVLKSRVKNSENLNSSGKKKIMKKLKKIKSGEKNRHFISVFGAGDCDEIEGILRLKLRVLLHEKILRVVEIAEIRMKDICNDYTVINNIICIDDFWRERLFTAFNQCDDWSWLLRTSLNKDKKNEKPNKDNINISINHNNDIDNNNINKNAERDSSRSPIKTTINYINQNTNNNINEEIKDNNDIKKSFTDNYTKLKNSQDSIESNYYALESLKKTPIQGSLLKSNSTNILKNNKTPEPFSSQEKSKKIGRNVSASFFRKN